MRSTLITLHVSVCLSAGEYIALYQNQRAIMKQRHMEKDQYINMLAKDKEEMKVPDDVTLCWNVLLIRISFRNVAYAFDTS